MNYKLRIKREIECQKKSKEHWETRYEELLESGRVPKCYTQYAIDCEIQRDIHHHAVRLLESLIG